MKLITLLIVICSCFSIKVIAQQSFTIEGKLDLKVKRKIILQYKDQANIVNDTLLLNNGQFSYEGKVTEPVKASLTMYSVDNSLPNNSMQYMQDDKIEFYIEQGKVKIFGESFLKESVIQGGEEQKIYQSLLDKLKPYREKMGPISAKLSQLLKGNLDNPEAEPFLKELRSLRREMNAIEEEFILKHPDSYVSLDMVNSHSFVIDLPKFEPLFNSLSSRMKKTTLGVQMAGKLEIAKKTAIGQIASNFVLPDTSGKEINLIDLRGKYVLLDFWASWCGPCRLENPNLVAAYNIFKDKGFEILAVSLDTNKASWKKAIEDDKLNWLHVSDLNGWKTSVAKEYGVIAVPQNVLIDPQGIIIAKNLRGESLKFQLEKFFVNK